MKAHLLHPHRDLDLQAAEPPQAEDLVTDLGLDAVVAAMAGGDKFLAEVARRVLLSWLEDPALISRRQAVLRDFLEQPDLLRELYAEVVTTLQERRHMWGYAWSFRTPRTVLSGARECLEMFLRHLRALRGIADRAVGSVRSEGLRTLFSSLQTDLDDEYLDTVETQLRRLHFGDGMLLSARLGTDASGTAYVLGTPERERPGWKQRLGLTSSGVLSFTLPSRDEAGVQALETLWARGLDEVANAAAQSADHIGDYFAMLQVELGFFLGCLNLADLLRASGQPLCWPEVAPAEQPSLAFTDLRDPGLALASADPVRGTDADADGASLLVITGANSGGKTTFLRSLGLAQVMTQAGMFVTAERLSVSVARGVLTHFVREEDASMTHGRLEEELARMRELVPHLRPGSLVLFNESFHSTNEREGSEIARQIVRALRDAGVRVAFVSHQYDFARTFLDQDGCGALFLRAVLGPDGRPSHRLVRGVPQPTAYGRELYEAVFAEPL